MPHTSAYDYKRREQRRRAGHILSPLARHALEDPSSVLEDLTKRVLSIHENQLHKLEQQQATGKGDIDPRLYAQVVKNTPTILAMLRKPKANGKPQPKQEEERKAPEPDAATSLLAAHRATAAGTPAPTFPATHAGAQGQAEQDSSTATDSRVRAVPSVRLPTHA
jgi:hypothetical protein